MRVMFVLDDDEEKVTPMKVAEALIEDGHFSNKDLKELIAYLSVYIKYHMGEK